MKNRLFISLMFIMALSNSLALAQDTKAPEIYIKEKAFTADEVMEGTIVEHTYTVYNRGDDVLKILNVETG